MDSIQNKKEQTTEIYYNIDEPQSHYATWKKGMQNATCYMISL